MLFKPPKFVVLCYGSLGKLMQGQRVSREEQELFS